MMSLLSPGLVLSLLVSTSCGAAFHAWRGGGYRRLLGYLLAAWGGFALGQTIAWIGGWQLATIGQVHPIEGIAGSLILLVLSSWLRLKYTIQV